LETAPGVSLMTNRPIEGPVKAWVASRANVWHTDATHLPRPPSFTFLSCVEPAPLGGDTMWCNQYLAYETLSETMKGMIRGRWMGFPPGPGYARFAPPGEAEEVFHPLVRVHADTGRKSLLVNSEKKSSQIRGLTEAESKPLKDYLYSHSQRPEHIYRHGWRKGDLVIWDNRCSMHYAINDYDPEATRLMYRVMVTGEAPIPDAAPVGADLQH
jgi:taurine dioxygenase